MISFKKGVTLVEVLVAAAILALIIVGTSKMFSSSAVQAVKVGNKAKAADVMAKFMEEVKHVPLKIYTEKLPDLLSGKEVSIPEKFYKETTAVMEDLSKEDKKFWINKEKTKVKAEINKYKQIVELVITCEIDWKEKGNDENSSQKDQSLRDFALIYNPDAKVD